MTVLNVGFTKLLGEKKQLPAGQVKVNTTVGMKSVTKADLKLGNNNQHAVRFDFEYKALYQPEIGSLTLEGFVVYLDSEEEVSSIVEKWEKSKEIKEDVMVTVTNKVLNKCQIQALIMSRELGLPSPIQLPKVGIKNESA